MLLLGDPETIEAGRTWHRRVWPVERFARGQRNDTERWQALRDDVIADGRCFYAAARRDIPHRGSWESDTDPELEWPATAAIGTDSG